MRTPEVKTTDSDKTKSLNDSPSEVKFKQVDWPMGKLQSYEVDDNEDVQSWNEQLSNGKIITRCPSQLTYLINDELN
jgi:hypothetical protein